MGNMMKTFTSSRGKTLNICGISKFKMDSMRTSREIPQPPTYEVKTATGEIQIVTIDSQIAKTKHREQEWEAYLKALQDEDTQFAKRFSELLFWEGIEIEVPGADSDWEKSCVRFGMKVPTDPVDRKIFYVTNEFLGDEQDMGDLAATIMGASGVDEEAVEKLKASFRLGIQRQRTRKMHKGKGEVENTQSNV